MKKSKLLIPALAIASVGATVAPVVTSCNKGYGGIKIEDSDWTSIITFFANTDHSANVTLKGKDTSSDTENVLKLDATKASNKEGSTESFLKYDTNAWKYYDKTKAEGSRWTDLPGDISAPDEFTAAIATLVVAMYGAVEAELANFKNGAYQYHNSESDIDMVIVFKKVNDEIRLTHFEVTAPESNAKTMSGKFDLSNYGKTEIANFPTGN